MRTDDITFCCSIGAAYMVVIFRLKIQDLYNRKIELWITQLLMPQERNQSHQSSWMDFFALLLFFFFFSHLNIRKSKTTFDVFHLSLSLSTHRLTRMPKFLIWSSKFDCAYDNVRSFEAIEWCVFCGYDMVLNFSCPQQYKPHCFFYSFSPSQGMTKNQNHQTHHVTNFDSESTIIMASFFLLLQTDWDGAHQAWLTPYLRASFSNICVADTHTHTVCNEWRRELLILGAQFFLKKWFYCYHCAHAHTHAR